MLKVNRKFPKMFLVWVRPFYDLPRSYVEIFENIPNSTENEG